ncbi:pyridoxal-dependent decarboxylase [Synechococcus sp. M16CYN]
MRPQPTIAPGTETADIDALLNDLQVVMDGAFQPSHPGSLAHLDPPPLTASIAAELVCAGLNNNLLADELSPGLSSLEHELCRWFCQRLGLPNGSGGVLASGGTLSNLMGLVTARTFGVGGNNGVILCSNDAHVSLVKAVRVMGLSDDALQFLPTDSEGRLCLSAVEQRLSQLRRLNRPCLAIVATAGTTVRGAIDLLPQLANLCRGAGIWLHVDAAIGGVFALSAAHAPLMRGLEQADSITLNPQKLLGITKASSLLLLRQHHQLRATFGTGLPYMENSTTGYHGGEVGLQGTRPAEVLKLWLGLRQLGEAGLETVLSSALKRREIFANQLDSDRLRLLPGALHLQAFHPIKGDPQSCEAWSQQTRQQLLSAGYMLSRPFYGDRFCLKGVFGNPHTTPDHLTDLAQRINASVF